jgi:parvulin-like peptidyl-prolyl isomerase
MHRILLIALSAEKGNVEKRLEAISGELSSGEEFADVARRYSDAPSASSGGDLGYLRPEEMNSTMREAVKGLKPGETSEPVTTAAGVYIIRLIDTRESEAKPLEEVSGVIREKLFQQFMDERFNYWLEQQKKSAHIEIRL